MRGLFRRRPQPDADLAEQLETATDNLLASLGIERVASWLAHQQGVKVRQGPRQYGRDHIEFFVPMSPQGLVPWWARHDEENQ